MSPARRKKAAKRAKKKSAKRPSRRVKKVAKRRSATKRKPAKRARKPAPRKPAKKAAKKAAKKKPTSKKPARRPKLKIVPRPKPKKPAPPPPFAEATAGASAKDLVLFELVRARVAFAAAIQGMSAGGAEQPTAPGKWSSREMVLHLAFWDREMLPLLEDAYQHGGSTSLRHEEILRRNPEGIAELRHHDWDSARRLLQTHRERLMEEFQSIPEEPAEMWSKDHPVGKLARILTHHDRHHAEKIKTARVARGESG